VEQDLFVIIGRSAFRLTIGNLRIQRLNDQAIRLELRSPNGLQYNIQESADLLGWADGPTITNTTGVFAVTNNLTPASSRFYRAVLRP
jgi:hypothetical protein